MCAGKGERNTMNAENTCTDSSELSEADEFAEVVRLKE